MNKTREAAKPFLEPIPGASPAGATARLEPVYQGVANEVAKLDMPRAARWTGRWSSAGGGAPPEEVEGRARRLVPRARAPSTGGLDGLATRRHGRRRAARAVLGHRLPRGEAAPRARERGPVARREDPVALAAGRSPRRTRPRSTRSTLASRRLAEVVRARFADQAPAMGPLLEQVGRAKATADAAKPPPAPPRRLPPPPPRRRLRRRPRPRPSGGLGPRGGAMPAAPRPPSPGPSRPSTSSAASARA